MKAIPALCAILMVLALVGAPFGMGRMMDNAPSHARLHQAHQMTAMMRGMDHETVPRHDPSAPHFMVCAASVAVSLPYAEPLRLALQLENLRPGAADEFDGTRLLPPVPPPRA